MNEILTKEGEVILLKTDNGQCFIRINYVGTDVRDGYWKIHFSPLTSVPLIDISWVLNSKQIRGEKFKIKGISHQLIKIEYLKINPNQKVIPIPKKVNDNVICLSTWKKNR